ncbi:MAG: polysaccharide deacetylase family sporulation protein PdaB [Clostridiaceae bacterium]
MRVIVIRKRILKIVAGFIILLALFLLFLGIYASKRNDSVFNNSKKLPIYSVDTSEKKIAITFDSTWGENNTNEILKILKKYDAKATFFLLGRWVEDFSAEAKAINDQGHEIGNHSYKHSDFSKDSKEEILKEISRGDEAIKKITGETPKLFRVPSGSYNDNAIDIINNSEHICIQWDVDSIDWKNEGVDVEYDRIMKKVNPGSIILFHNGAKYTPKTLERVLAKLSADGYQFVSVSDLIYKNNYIIDINGKQILSKELNSE